MSIYSQATLGEADNQLVFNDYTLDPVFRALGRSANRFQIRQQELPVAFESGSNDFLTLLGDTAYIIQGKMYPGGEGSYDEGLIQLRTVCSLDINQADVSSDNGYVPYVWGDADGDNSKQIFVKPLYVEISETTQQGYVQPFIIYCKVKDPTIFSGATKTASTQESDASLTTGSAVFSKTFPLIFGSTTFAVSSSAQNNGTLPGYPASITVHGPVNNPVITNQTTGESIEVDVNMTQTTDLLTLIYDKDTLSINFNGTSEIQNVTNNSTLFKIQPGENIITLTGTTVSNGAYAEVNYYDTYPLA